jgi:HAD superfamily hydrolase (TIGR01450 family)
MLFLTNDPQSSRAEHAARLAGIGIPATPADVMTSGAVAARFLAGQAALAGKGVLALGSQALQDELIGAGLRLVPPEAPCSAAAVLVAGHPGFDYRELRAATTAVLNGALLYATGRDAVYPTRHGPQPATGAILAAVETATGVAATVIGKPEPLAFETAREALAGCLKIAVVGDHLVSDIAGAKRAGLSAILVLSGTSTTADLHGAAIQPDHVLPSLADLPLALRS